MKTGKPFLIAGVPIAGLALQSWSANNYGVASAWTPPASHVVRGRRHPHRRPTTASSSSTSSSRTATALSSTDIDIDMDSLHLTSELEMMTNAFSSIPDEKTRHKQLLHMASKLPTVDDSVRVPENKVPGCLSTVHVDCTMEKSEDEELVVNYFGDSDGLLTKGLLALLIRGLSGCTPEQINAVDPQFIQAAKISQTLTPGRNNGFLNMLAVMKKKASQAVEKDSETIDATNDTDGAAAEPISDDEGKPMYNAILSSLTMLKPTSIKLTDNSSQHAGHAGSKGWEEGESHFALEIVAEAFEGLNVVKRHQLIYMLLGEVMPKIHALEISAKSTSEVE
mmetsp:Transcript_14540/g.31598  ORF Transcript_14540/g.31598 Transcript_14540/m.31598 type:complete len:337 (-) Transcript_14540:98-1108(-)|eukprot:CAMPEP_0172298228 /NCGR_PEP_ID=MMETSP1058-20130122/976_1 /TAXON_ID=83371 /ORGANISM="Detonula confervacea, Strain CCMP 353" /LENGTH=336 /DNA_ID=CAMNT_0013007489 /DNA_START=3 /DNA_END=1013 /DNA_ORIENTATION=-